MSYITVDQVATTALALGKGAMIAKIDIKSAYRLIPVYPGDWQMARHEVGQQSVC